MASLTPADFNADVVDEFRAKGGYVDGLLADFRLILVFITSVLGPAWKQRPAVGLFHASGDGALDDYCLEWRVEANHPAWYYNLKRHARVTVELGTERFWALAEELEPEARSLVWPTIVERSPAAGEFQRAIARTIPVFVLTREE